MKIFCYTFSLLLFLQAQVFAQDALFENIANAAGIQQAVNGRNFGAAWGDFDNDGDADLFVATVPNNDLYRNDGGVFTNIAASAGVQDGDMEAIGAAWGDYDGDGDLDLYVCNIEPITGDLPINRLYKNNGDGTFTDVAHEAGVEGYPEEHDHEDEAASLPTQVEEEYEEGAFTSASWIDYDLDGWLDLMVSSRTYGPVLYKNLGDGSFEYVSEEAGLLAEHDHEIETDTAQEDEHDHDYYSIEHAAWGDYDNDGDLDVYFSIAVAHAHDHESEAASFPQQDEHEGDQTENRFFVNNGDGTFTEMTDEVGLGAPNAASSNSAVWGDYDNDGDVDLFVCNIGSINEDTAIPQHLYQNNGDGTFTDVFPQSGMTEQFYLFNASWVDLNNDGWLDLLAINHPDHDDYPAGQLYPFPHPIFMNNGDGTFTNINETADQALLDTGVDDINHLIAVSCGDLDNDGDLEFLFTENHGEGPTLLYENNAVGDNHWLNIQLQGNGANGFAFGARVKATVGGVTQIRQCGFGDTGFGSQSSSVIHFGLGAEISAEVQVTWLDGSSESFGEMNADQFITVIQSEGEQTVVKSWYLY
ncbi:MAG: CRTAC1 family protein [Candidatus Hinthialibacter antarcticus]|nr:CRTAC1 family protein [Candidatus Hinthialibacter antarcticus]